MDRDGVEASVTYCEVSAFRYLYLVRDGRKESTRAFNTALAEFASEDPTPADRLVPDSDPRHRRRDRRSAVGGRERLQVAATPGVPDRARPRRLLGRALRAAVRRDPGDGPSDLLPHRDEHDARRSRAAGPHTAEGHLRPDGAALGRRIARHVDHGRRLREVPAAQGRVRRARPRLGVVVAVRRRRPHDPAGLRVPGDHRAAEPLLPPERLPHVRRRTRRARAGARPARRRERDVVVRLPAPRDELPELEERSSTRCSRTPTRASAS